MNHTILRLGAESQISIWDHLLRNKDVSEEAAFAFVQRETLKGVDIFTAIDWYAVRPDEFEYRSKYHIELSDDTKALVIKKAHDYDASLVEFHSHLGRWPAEFSPSDFSGLRDFVPHILWRLNGRPYVAVVITPAQDFDGLVWTSTDRPPAQLNAIETEHRTLFSTGLSIIALEDEYGN
jgi:hypothetical protein